jgi:hypothetical protein
MTSGQLKALHLIVYLISVAMLLAIQGCSSPRLHTYQEGFYSNGCIDGPAWCSSPRWHTSQEGQTQLMVAVQDGDMEVVRKLVESGQQDVNAQCSAGRGNSALSLAIINEDVDMVRYLVKAGANTKIEVLYVNSYSTGPSGGGSIYSRTADDFNFVQEKRATISELARMSGVPEIIEAVKKGRPSLP